jgi:hypothetical protein
MTYIGTVKKGVVVLPPDAKLPEGAKVMVELRPEKKQSDNGEKGKTLAERYGKFIGVCKGLPSDLAEQHDHYIHGTPKK